MTGYTTLDVIASISYDAANRKTGESVSIGAVTKTYSYSYDAKGNKASFTSPEGVTYSYTYNKNDQPTRITTPAGAISLDYTWVRNSKATLPNGVVTDYSYNANSWLTNIAAQKLPSTVFSAGYQFDKVGNITQKANDVTTAYGYDKTYQLLNSTNSETFTYDKVGNRKTRQGTQTPWSYNKNNELLTAEMASFDYDNNGNTTSKTENGQTTTFGYGVTDRLTSVQLPDGRTAVYTYDPFGRRIKKQVGSETTIFVYADEGLVGEYTTQGTAAKTYGWRPDGIWGTNPIFQTENGQYYFYHNDHLGTPQTLTDAQGDIVWEAAYEVFGKANVDPESTLTSNLRFPGQYWDEETRLHYNWNRYYDPAGGRYLEKDPIGFIGSDINLFRYGASNPLKMIDPLGLYLWTIADLERIESIMESWEDAYTEYAPKTDVIYRGSGAKKGVRADCTGSIYAIINEAGFKVPYLNTARLDPRKTTYDSNTTKYYKPRASGEMPQRGDLVLLEGHLVYYIGQNSNGSHEVFGAHYFGGDEFNRHSYKNKSFKPIVSYYYDGPEPKNGDKNPSEVSGLQYALKQCHCRSINKKAVFNNYNSR